MPLTKIETFLFGEIDFASCAAMVGNFGVEEGVVTVEVVTVPNKKLVAKALFENAEMNSSWIDPEDTIEWPLDIIGFDCYESRDRWKFVLNCNSMEFTWESDWPSVA